MIIFNSITIQETKLNMCVYTKPINLYVFHWFWKLYLQITSSERHDFFPLENSSEYLYTLITTKKMDIV